MPGTARVLRNTFSWSHSRHETFLECPRRYYYHYYGAWGGWSWDAETRVRRIYVLKNLKPRQVWAGGVVHEIVADALRDIRAGRPVAAGPGREAAEGAVARLRREFRESRDGAYLTRPKQAIGLMEHHYREPVPDAEWRELAEAVRLAVLRFHEGPYLDEARALDAEAWLALEDLATFEQEGVPVFVRLDLAMRAGDDGVTIVDWKTGRRAPRPEGLQLATYALFVQARWQVAPSAIEVREVNLSSGAEGRGRVSPQQLEAARETIRDSMREMRARLVDAAENRAREEDFVTRPGPRTCPRCVFREICPETSIA
jgi:hypothetical protein